MTPVEETSALGRELILDLKILIPDLKITSPPNYFGLVHVYPLCAQTVFVKLYIIIMDPPGVFIVFVTLLFFTITIHTATDKSADDVGNYYVELAET